MKIAQSIYRETLDRMNETARRLSNENLETALAALAGQNGPDVKAARASLLTVYGERHGDEALDRKLDELGL